MRRLKELGVIAKQVVILDTSKIVQTLTAIIEVTLDVQTAEQLQSFEELMQKEPCILQCYRVSTGPDFVLIAQVRDMQAYHALVQRALTAEANVRNVRTFFSVHRSKFDTQIALNDLR